ncbi:uncharacterized protein LOC113359702 [Papaver somniferum]|uniref:uncharacterized protein LOC113359702 n=1 Tax=Papaver somniferum TaxID=3469 RepID=UPI000E6FBEC8|nr:uncharacterized protein LOC113359702 [Papaver somniferum]
MINDIVFSNVNFSKHLVLKGIVQDFNLCLVEESSSENSSKIYRSPDWSTLPSPFIKINVDGAFIPNNADAGEIARDYNGKFMGCGSSTFDAASPLLAEVVACKLGLQLAIMFGFNDAIIEGDASNVTSVVLGEISDIPWSIRSVILEIRDMTGSFAVVKF